MEKTEIKNSPVIEEKKFRYQEMALVELIERIVCDGDTHALNELHENRPVFRYQGKRGLLMVDFLVQLKDRRLTGQWCGYNEVTIERAFDLALSKFLNIPQKNSGPPETAGSDCRYYYDAYLQCINERIQDSLDAIETELMAATLLETFVIRQFYLSCLECRRREQKIMRRIFWELDGRRLSLWMPNELTAKQCRQWLNEHIVDVDPYCDWDRDRIQNIIDRNLARRKLVSFASFQVDEKVAGPSFVSSVIQKEMATNGLAETLANEKADQIESQRPAIRLLGKQKLKTLIHKTFDNLMNHGKDYQYILSEFGLTKATYNRFAGSKWHENETEDSIRVPDLWKNAAHLLARHPDFVEVAQQTGVWKKVCQALGN